MAERIIGIDFGTSTSVIRVKRYENGKPLGEVLETKEVLFGGVSATVPTLIAKKNEDNSVAYYGYEAQQKRRNFTTYSNFKVDLESADPEKRALARRLTEEFFAYLSKQYRAQADSGHLGDAEDEERTVISYPVKWSEETKRFMVEAARKADFPNVTGMDEAQAAIQAVTVMSDRHLRNNNLLVYGKNSNILLIDMGAGTTDLVLCRYTPGEKAKKEILSTWPKDGSILFGGREIDALLRNFFWDKMDETDAEDLFKRIGTDKFKSWKEELVSPALRHNDSVREFEVLDSYVEMMGIDMDAYCLDRSSFEACMGDYLKQLPTLIKGCISNSGISGRNVDLVIVTGGHSQWYFVEDILAGRMPQLGKVDLPRIQENPARIIPIARPQETVALGLVYSPVQRTVPGPVLPKPAPGKTDPVLPKSEPPKPVPVMPLEEGYTPAEEFELIAKGEDYVISKYTGNRKVVVIPPVIRNRSVVAIGAEAFVRMAANPEWQAMSFGQRFMTSIPMEINTVQVEKVIIPNSVKVIGVGAFKKCKNLHTVIAHSDISEISKEAFYKCSSLKNLDFGVGKPEPGYVWFPKKLKRLGSGAFCGCGFVEAMVSKRTTWKALPLSNDPNALSCRVFNYKD